MVSLMGSVARKKCITLTQGIFLTGYISHATTLDYTKTELYRSTSPVSLIEVIGQPDDTYVM
jgi:hypothetical protein